MPLKDPEERRAYKRRYSKTPKEKERLRRYNQRPEVKEKVNQRVRDRRQWWQGYRERRKERGRITERRKYRETRIALREQVLALFGSACPRCGYSADHRALQIDHVNGDGARERQEGGYSLSWYRGVLRSVQAGEQRYQVLCCNCNWLKRYEDGTTGHDQKPISRTGLPGGQLQLPDGS